MAAVFKTFVADDVLTASEVNTYLMPQVIVVCDAAADRTGLSAAEGWAAYQKDTNVWYLYTGSAWVPMGTAGAWTSYTPTWGGAVTIGNGTSTGAWTQVGKTVHWRAKLVLGSTSSVGSNSATVTLPATGTAANSGIGNVHFYDVSSDTGSPSPGGLTLGFLVYGTTTATLFRTAAGGSYVDSAALGSTVPFTWTTSDEIRVSGTYEAA